jgi:hypothetical protein
MRIDHEAWKNKKQFPAIQGDQNLRHEAMLMLDKRGAVIETAKVIPRLLRDNQIPGAIIGGVAVVLHGHIRTTRGVDELIQQPLKSIRPIMEREGMSQIDPPVRAEFRKLIHAVEHEKGK